MLQPTLRDACLQRRTALLQMLGNVPAVIPAGRALPRNYPANTFPFRASSHFLYLVGAAVEGAVLWLDGAETCLLVPARDPNDDLWHGPLPDQTAFGHALGVTVRPLSELPNLRHGRAVACVPVLDGREAKALCSALHRNPELLGQEAQDAPLLEALIGLRLRHDPAAVQELKRAAAVSVRAHRAGMQATRAGRLERDVCASMEAVIAGAGFGTAYGSIVTTHGEVLHNQHHHHTLADGDLLLADVGAESDTGYASDITRTWPVSGRFSATQRELYELVLAMQRAAIEKAAPGVRYRELHLTAARVLVDGLVQLKIFRGEVDALVEDGSYALFFPHGIGHLLGLDVHDMEDLGDRAGYAPGRTRDAQFGLSYLRLDRDLSPGMLVTIEPGFYQVPSLLRDPGRVGLDDRALDRQRLAAFADVRGIRIEDDVLITALGNEVLTQALLKDVTDIEELMRQRA